MVPSTVSLLLPDCETYGKSRATLGLSARDRAGGVGAPYSSDGLCWTFSWPLPLPALPEAHYPGLHSCPHFTPCWLRPEGLPLCPIPRKELCPGPPSHPF